MKQAKGISFGNTAFYKKKHNIASISWKIYSFRLKRIELPQFLC